MYFFTFLCGFMLVLEVYGNHPLRFCEGDRTPKTVTDDDDTAEDNDSEPWLADKSELYRLDDQLIRISYDSRYSDGPYPSRYEVLVLNGCQSHQTVDAKVFDADEIFKYAYHADVWNVRLPPIPESSQLTDVSLRDAVPGGVWGSCEFLSYLYIQRANLADMPSDWLSNCTHLRRLSLDGITAAQAHAILDTAPSVWELSMTNMEMISDIFRHPLFPTLRGAEKQIYKFELAAISEADSLPANVTWAGVSEALVWQISTLTALQELHITNFKHFDFCAMANYPSITLLPVKSLHVSDSGTAHLCFKTLRILPNLTDLELGFNLFNELQFSELYSTNLPKFSVSFDDSRRLRLHFTREDYLALNDGNSKGKIALSVRSSIACECGAALWVRRALRERLVSDLEVTCADGSSLSSLNCEMTECDRIYCDGPCVCCHDNNGLIDVDCRDTDLYEIPKEVLLLENVSSLLAPNVTHLSTLPHYLPDSLKLIDLTGNNVLLKASPSEVKLLLQTPRQVRLAGNGVVCSCENKPVLEILRDHRDQIEDYEELVCVDDGAKLKDLNFGILCSKQQQQIAILISVSGALVLAALALALGAFLYYKRELQIFLFARGWCLCLVQEDELDADRLYDVFLSFCHEDAEFVFENLLPILDQEYSVCVHYRDWSPGEMILTQIIKSISQSRRTVVVVSRKFVKSLWGLLEFRTAHSSGLTEGRVRLVMVIIDDILEENQLEGEIRSYVRMNTYVKWGDPWFWDKLRYALPHNPAPRVIGTDGYPCEIPRVEIIEFPDY